MMALSRDRKECSYAVPLPGLLQSNNALFYQPKQIPKSFQEIAIEVQLNAPKNADLDVGGDLDLRTENGVKRYIGNGENGQHKLIALMSKSSALIPVARYLLLKNYANVNGTCLYTSAIEKIVKKEMDLKWFHFLVDEAKGDIDLISSMYHEATPAANAATRGYYSTLIHFLNNGADPYLILPIILARDYVEDTYQSIKILLDHSNLNLEKTLKIWNQNRGTAFELNVRGLCDAISYHNYYDGTEKKIREKVHSKLMALRLLIAKGADPVGNHLFYHEILKQKKIEIERDINADLFFKNDHELENKLFNEMLNELNVILLTQIAKIYELLKNFTPLSTIRSFNFLSRGEHAPSFFEKILGKKCELSLPLIELILEFISSEKIKHFVVNSKDNAIHSISILTHQGIFKMGKNKKGSFKPHPKQELTKKYIDV